MADRLTDDDLAALQALDAAARPGAWSREFSISQCVVHDAEGHVLTAATPRFATLAMAARNALPALLAELRARREADRWRDAETETPRYYWPFTVLVWSESEECAGGVRPDGVWLGSVSGRPIPVRFWRPLPAGPEGA